MFKFSPFSRQQRRVLNWWTDRSPVRGRDGIIADGAIRSGKTLSMSLSYVIWAMERFDGQNFGMAGKTIKSFRRNVLKDLLPVLETRGYRVADHRGDNTLVIRRKGKENTFYVFGGKDERSQDLVQGITCAGFFFDEVALMPESFVNQATGRCSVEGSKWWFNCNPDSPYHWFKTEWIDRAKDKGLIYLHFTMDDNRSLAETIKARYRSQYSGVFYKRYILGLWCMAEGIIYDMFDEGRHVKPLKDFAGVLTDRRPYVSIDYGTQNPTAMLLWQKGTDGRWYCLREYYYSGREQRKQKTDAEFADDLGRWLDGTEPRALVVDPSAASFIAELRKRGFHVLKADNDVLDGIRLMGTLLNRDRLVFADSCRSTIKEFGTYAWDEKAAQRGEDRPVKTNDHAMDSARYFVSTVIGGGKTARIRSKEKAGLN